MMLCVIADRRIELRRKLLKWLSVSKRLGMGISNEHTPKTAPDVYLKSGPAKHEGMASGRVHVTV